MATLYAQPATNARTAYNAESAGGLVTAIAKFDIAVDNAGVAIATNDVVQMLKIPKNHVIVDLYIDTDVIAAAVGDVGLVSGTNAEFITGHAFSTTAKFARADVAGFCRLGASTDEEVIAIEFTTGSAATTGAFYVSVQYRPVDFGL